MNLFNRAAMLGASFILLSSPAIGVAEDASLDEIIVSASRTSQTVDESLAPVTLITRKDIDALQPESLPDLLRKTAPGVDLSITGGLGQNSSLFLRGAESDHVLVLIDGVRAGSATTGAMAWSTLPTELIERIEIVRGPRSSLYGSEAIGGIISITTRKGKNGSWRASVARGSFDTQKASVGASLGNNRTHFSANASYVDTDGINAKVSNNPDKDGYDNKGLNMQLQHQLTDKTSLSLSALYAKGSAEYDDFGDDNRNSHSAFVQQNLGAIIKSRLTSRWDTKVTLGEYRDKTRAFDGFPGFFNTRRQQLNWQNDIAFGNDSLLTLGIDHQRDEIDSSTDYVESSRDNTGAFAELQSHIGQHDFQLAIRNDDNEAFGTHTTGSIAVGRNFGKSSRLTASYGTAFKAPTFNELYFPNYGNAKLKPEESGTFEVGLRTHLGKGRIDARVFRTHISNLINAVLIDPANFSYQAQNVDKARIDGLELGYTRQLGKLNLNTNLTLLNPRDRNSGAALESRVKQTLKLNLDRDFGRLSLGGTVLAQGQRAKGTFSNTVPGYATVDVRAAYKLGKHVKVKAELNNLLDKDYQTKDGFNMPDRNVMLTLSYE